MSTGVPDSSERPYYEQWAAGKTRESLTPEQIVQYNKKYAAYSQKRFYLGRRFKLYKNYAGIPKGTCVTVVGEWPQIILCWDKWGNRGGYGQRENRLSDLSIDLDDCLEYVDG